MVHSPTLYGTSLLLNRLCRSFNCLDCPANHPILFDFLAVNQPAALYIFEGVAFGLFADKGKFLRREDALPHNPFKGAHEILKILSRLLEAFLSPQAVLFVFWASIRVPQETSNGWRYAMISSSYPPGVSHKRPLKNSTSAGPRPSVWAGKATSLVAQRFDY
jgi:hypothetical protein